jgi:NifU-like protein
MSIEKLITPYFWNTFSKKMKQKIENPKFAGFFLAKEAERSGMRLATGTDGSIQEGNMVTLYWLVDETDGVIADCKFQVYGPTYLIVAAETICEMVIRKNYDQASRISADLVDRQVRDNSKRPAFTEEGAYYLNMVMSAVDFACHQCQDIPFKRDYADTPIDFLEENQQMIPDFENLAKEVKLQIIEEIISKEIRPYIEMDAGGVTIHDLKGSELHISYEGACTSCHAATGSTLSAIQNILKTRVHPSITVIPII